MKTLRLLLFGLMLLWGKGVLGQVEIKGTVYDQSQQFAVPRVSVLSTSGAGTMTDSLGRYKIRVSLADSLYFSYLGRATAKYPVRDLPPNYPFDMSLAVAVDSLPSVFVQSRNYEQDSLANRKEYKKVFEFSPNYVKGMKMGERRAGFGIGLDMDALFFDAKANRRMLALQKRLEEEEQDKYIDHRWNRAIVRRVTGLESPKLDSFMREYRPSYAFIQSCETDYEFYKYIQEWGRFFEENWKAAHKE